MIYMKFRRLNKKKYLFYKKNKQSFTVIRPLIQLTRFDTFSLLSFWSLPLYIDQSNYLFFCKRNRLRKQIIPLLKYFFNPNLEKVLKDFIKILIVDKIYFQNIIQKIVENFDNKMLEKAYIYFPLSIQNLLVKKIVKLKEPL